MANVNRLPMMSYLQPNKQKPLMMNFNGGQSPLGGNRSSSGQDFIPNPLDRDSPHPILDPGWQTPPGWHPPMLNPKPPVYVKPYHYEPDNPYLPETPHIPNPLYPYQGPYGPRKPPADYDDYWGPGVPNPLAVPNQ